MAETHSDEVHTSDVVLDIGGDIGALILRTSPEMNGKEIELSSTIAGSKRFHNQVHERRIEGRTVFAAVYPEIQAGEYYIWGDGLDPVETVTVRGGEVAEIDWS
jgi:hypothetical protein